MTEQEKNYKCTAKRFYERYGVTESELIYVYEQRNAGNLKALEELCAKHKQPKLQDSYVHFYVAYSQYLRSIGNK